MRSFSEAIYRTVAGLVVLCSYLFLLAPLLVVFLISFDASPNLEFPPKDWSCGGTPGWPTTGSSSRACGCRCCSVWS